MLALLAEHQVLTTDQVAGMLFGSRTRAQHRLVELFRMRVLWRFRFPRVAGGSQPWHYTLGYTGARLIAARKGVRPPRPGEHAEWLERLAESPRLGHLLGVNDFFTGLAAHARRAGWPNPNVLNGSGLDAWRSEADMTHRHHGKLRPDGFGCWAEDGRLLAFYLEYDTGTETLARVAAKLDDYTNAHTRQNPPLFGMVLFTVASARREAGLRAALAKKRCPAPIATMARDLARHDGPAGAVWALLNDGPHPSDRVRIGQLAELIGGTSEIGQPLVLAPPASRLTTTVQTNLSTSRPETGWLDAFDDDGQVQLIDLGEDDP